MELDRRGHYPHSHRQSYLGSWCTILPDAQWMVYLPTLTPKTTQMWVSQAIHLSIWVCFAEPHFRCANVSFASQKWWWNSEIFLIQGSQLEIAHGFLGIFLYKIPGRQSWKAKVSNVRIALIRRYGSVAGNQKGKSTNVEIKRRCNDRIFKWIKWCRV